MFQKLNIRLQGTSREKKGGRKKRREGEELGEKEEGKEGEANDKHLT